MIHGMEEYAENPPLWQNSEAKIGAAASELRALAPDQLQLYTVQIDFARCRLPPAFIRYALSLNFDYFPLWRTNEDCDSEQNLGSVRR